MAEEEVQADQAVAAGDDDDEENLGYKAPAPKSLDEILKADEEDESLRKYKEQLLAGAGAEKIVVGVFTWITSMHRLQYETNFPNPE
jgi:hypothetical protein